MSYDYSVGIYNLIELSSSHIQCNQYLVERRTITHTDKDKISRSQFLNKTCENIHIHSSHLCCVCVWQFFFFYVSLQVEKK